MKNFIKNLFEKLNFFKSKEKSSSTVEEDFFLFSDVEKLFDVPEKEKSKNISDMFNFLKNKKEKKTEKKTPFNSSYVDKEKLKSTFGGKIYRTNSLKVLYKRNVEVVSFSRSHNFKIIIKKNFFLANLYNIVKRRYYLITGVSFVYFRTPTKERLKELWNH